MGIDPERFGHVRWVAGARRRPHTHQPKVLLLTHPPSKQREWGGFQTRPYETVHAESIALSWLCLSLG